MINVLCGGARSGHVARRDRAGRLAARPSTRGAGDAGGAPRSRGRDALTATRARAASARRAQTCAVETQSLLCRLSESVRRDLGHRPPGPPVAGWVQRAPRMLRRQRHAPDVRSVRAGGPSSEARLGVSLALVRSSTRRLARRLAHLARRGTPRPPRARRGTCSFAEKASPSVEGRSIVCGRSHCGSTYMSPNAHMMYSCAH